MQKFIKFRRWIRKPKWIATLAANMGRCRSLLFSFSFFSPYAPSTISLSVSLTRSFPPFFSFHLVRSWLSNVFSAATTLLHICGFVHLITIPLKQLICSWINGGRCGIGTRVDHSVCELCRGLLVKADVLMRVAHQIHGVFDPQVRHEAVLRQCSLKYNLDTSRISFLHLKIYVSLILCQLWRFRDQLENKQEQH